MKQKDTLFNLAVTRHYLRAESCHFISDSLQMLKAPGKEPATQERLREGAHTAGRYANTSTTEHRLPSRKNPFSGPNAPKMGAQRSIPSTHQDYVLTFYLANFKDNNRPFSKAMQSSPGFGLSCGIAQPQPQPEETCFLPSHLSTAPVLTALRVLIPHSPTLHQSPPWPQNSSSLNNAQ